MEARVEELQITWTEVAKRSGLSREALRLARTRQTKLNQATKDGIDRALEWVPGKGVDAILAGRTPLKLDDVPRQSRVETDADRPTSLGALLDELDDPVQVLRILGEQLEDLGPDVFWATLGRIWRYHTTQSAGDGDSRQVG